MTFAAAQLLVDASAFYAGIGALFAVGFLWRWIGYLDAAAAHATWGFRILVFPGVVMLWPLFALRLLRGATSAPDEWTAHRSGARRRGRVEVLR